VLLAYKPPEVQQDVDHTKDCVCNIVSIAAKVQIVFLGEENPRLVSSSKTTVSIERAIPSTLALPTFLYQYQSLAQQTVYINLPSIQERQQIQDRNHRNDSKIYLAQRLSFIDVDGFNFVRILELGIYNVFFGQDTGILRRYQPDLVEPFFLSFICHHED
jgi:hypothetical protein